MPAVITPSAVLDSTATLDRAVAGERMMMDGGATPLATLLQKITNIAAFAAAGCAQALEWSGQMWAQGTAAVPVVWVGPVDCVVLPRAALTTTYEKLSGLDATLGIGDVDGLPANLAASTWYYVYAYNNAGSLAYQISTTPPTEAATPTVLGLYKRATITHRYLGCFVTDAAGNPVPVRRAGGRYTYVFEQAAAATFQVYSGISGAGAWTAQTMTQLVPPHSFRASLAWQFTDATALNEARMRPTGATTGYKSLWTQSISAVQFAQLYNVDMILGTGQSIDHQVAVAVAGAGGMVIHCTGYEE